MTTQLHDSLAATFDIYVASVADAKIVAELGRFVLALPRRKLHSSSFDLLFGFLTVVINVLKQDQYVQTMQMLSYLWL